MKHLNGKSLSIVWIITSKSSNLSLNYLSILGQKINNCDLIIVDLANNVNVKNICKNWNKGKIKYNKINSYSEITSILLKIKSDYISFINDIDQYKYDKLQTQLNYMINNNIDFSYSYSSYISYTKKRERAIPIKKYISCCDIKSCLEIGLSSIMIRNMPLVFNTKNINSESELVYSILCNYKKGILLPQILTYISKNNPFNTSKLKIHFINKLKINLYKRITIKFKLLLENIY